MLGHAVLLRLPSFTKVRLRGWSSGPNYDSSAGIFSKTALNETVVVQEDRGKCGSLERILITGISCRLPSANSMEEFQNQLLAGVDMVSQHSRWSTRRLPLGFGLVRDYDKFDAEFFGIVPKLAECMDPQQRKLLEVAFEAIIDAGLNPADLRGTRTGVYVGALGGETSGYNTIHGRSDSYLKLQAMACPGFMLANRISFALDLKGTSLHVNTGCSASLVALEEAVSSIQRGTCDAAIVASSTIILTPDYTEAFAAMDALAPDGACKTFDDAANGFVRSEAAVAIVIQKESAAKRNYATIRHIQSNSDGYKDEGIMFPSGKGQEDLLRSCYSESGINPAVATYIEAHGTATPAGDPQEVQAIYNVFCRDVQRQSPLIVGSVKTNIGHTECAAGLCGIAKVITLIQKGVIPANLHFKEPHRAIRHLFGSALEVASGSKEWKGGLIGISAFGIGGTNSHLILEPGPIKAEPGVPASVSADLPVIVPFSGRTYEAVYSSIGRAAELGAVHSDVFSLLQNAFRRTIPGYSHRGFGIVQTHTGGKAQVIEVEALDTHKKRSLWYVFPGMGAQWLHMGKDLMKFEAFAESMMESARTMKNVGVDLDKILGYNSGSSVTSSDDSIYSNVRHAFVTTAAVQIALYDLLTCIGLRPDGYVGHSAGEILCTYADGCLSGKDTLLVSDACGRAILEGVQEEGSMASIGLTLEQAKYRVPRGILISCHNAQTNVGLSGRPAVLRNFLQKLRAEGVFAREINSSGVALHNKYYVGNAPQLLQQYMTEICPEPRLRSSKWISTSIPEEDWNNNPIAHHASAAYFANSLLQPVLFHEATKHIPSDAIVVEVSPSEYFQGLLRKSLPGCYHVAPMSSTANDKIIFFLHKIGKLHNVGLDVDLQQLYIRKGVSYYPVPANVPCLSPLVRWKHEQSWSTSIVTYPKRHGRTSLVLDLHEPSLSYLRGHRLGETVVFPAAGYLILAWKGLAEDHGQLVEEFPITFQNVSFKCATLLGKEAALPTKIRFSVLDGDGHFTITNAGTAEVVASGIIKPIEASQLFNSEKPKEREDAKENMGFLIKSEAYKELRLRGYHYDGDFQGIEQISIDGKNAAVRWTKNWTNFLDALLQTILFSIKTRCTLVPSSIDRITINPKELLTYIRTGERGQSVPVVYKKYLQAVTCPGVEIHRVSSTAIPNSRHDGPVVYEKYAFTPFFCTRRGEAVNNILLKVAGLLKDNADVMNDEVSAIEIAYNPETSIARLIFQGLDRTWRRRTPKVTLMTLSYNAERVPHDLKDHSTVQVALKDSESELLGDISSDLVVLHDSSRLTETAEAARGGSFILCWEGHRYHDTASGKPSLRIVLSLLGDDGNQYALYRKIEESANFDIMHISINSNSFNWVPKLQLAMQQHPEAKDFRERRVYITSQGDPHCGILGLMKCLRREGHSDKIRAIFDPIGTREINFRQSDVYLSEIVANDLVTTVFEGGQPGFYCHLPLAHPPQSLLKSVEHAYVNQLKTGDLESLRWLQSPDSHHNAVCPVASQATTFCRVAYASINSRDAMIACGKVPVDSVLSTQDCLIGYEISGEVYNSSGKRVMGLVSSKGLATSVAVSNSLLFPVPESWSLEDAATVPLAYCTAYWALIERGRLRPAQSVLIHCGTGEVGQASISVALAHSCEVFTTVGSEDERQYIKQCFPQLRDDHIGNSLDCSFERQFMKMTDGRGIELILNSLADDQLEASIRCLANEGKFIDVRNSRTSANRYTVDTTALGHAEYHTLSLMKVFESAAVQQRWKLRENFLRGLESGEVKPLPRRLFKADQIEDAFLIKATQRFMGKILLDVCNSSGGFSRDGSVSADGGVKTIKALARTYFHPQKTYVVIGGLGGLGLEVANWLVDRGARHLVLLSRSGMTSGYQSMYLQRWRADGAHIEASEIDLTDFMEAEKFIKSIRNSGKTLGGIFNSALILRDNLMPHQTVADFQAVADPKIVITKHMDALTRMHFPDLDYFVTFSSIASGLGLMAQANYGYANSSMERICQKRVADGLHGLAIQWGPIRDIGALEKHFNVAGSASIFDSAANSRESILGFRPQSPVSCMEVLDNALQQHEVEPVVTSVILAEKEGGGAEQGGRGQQNLSSLGLLGIVSKIFGVRNISRLRPTTKLSELGLDSLIAAELKRVFERDYDFLTTVKEMRSITIADLQSIDNGLFVAKRFRKSEETTSLESGKEHPPPPLRHLASLFKLHEDLIIKLGSDVRLSVSDLPPLFIVHGNFAGMRETFEPLASRLDSDSYVFQFGRYAHADSLRKLARAYVRELQLLQSQGPYNVCGYSGGGTVAFEIAIILEQQYKAEVANLIFLDGSCDWTVEGTTDMKVIMQNLLSTSEFFAAIPETVKEELLQSLTGHKRDIGRAASFLSRLGSSSADADEAREHLRQSIELFLQHHFRTFSHVPSAKFNGRATLIRAAANQFFTYDTHNVQKHCRLPVSCHTVSGNHTSFLSETYVAETAEIMREVLHRK